MDTLTHALSGVLAARAIGGPIDRSRSIAVAAAAAFPDLDYALILVDPMHFLNLHRGPSHSLLLLPVWAGVLGLTLGRLLRIDRLACAAWCGLGLLAHIAGDWVTLYGTQLFYPWTDQAFALQASFDINPWIALAVIIGLLGSQGAHAATRARLALTLTAGLLAAQAAFGARALQIAADQAAALGLPRTAAQIAPQPWSPFHWALRVDTGAAYQIAYLDLYGATARVMPGSLGAIVPIDEYRARDDLAWDRYAGPDASPLAREAWDRPALAPFRRFAEAPALWAVDSDGGGGDCVWFTDLRYLLPRQLPAFRYGMCRAGRGDAWQPYRLRYFSDTQRQAL